MKLSLIVPLVAAWTVTLVGGDYIACVSDKKDCLSGIGFQPPYEQPHALVSAG